MKNCIGQGVPNLEDAKLILIEAEKLNPTPWVKHSSKTEETDYDKLIKLCDYISLHSGFTLIEKRLVDIAIRGGINEYIIPRWKSTFAIKNYFEQKIWKSIYELLPRVIENTFELQNMKYI